MVANIGTGSGDADTVSLIDIEAKPARVVHTVTVGPTPEGIALSPDGAFVAVGVMNGSNKPKADPFFTDYGLVKVLSVKGNELVPLTEAKVGHWCQGFAWSKDNRTLLVQCMVENEIMVFDFDGKALKPAGSIKVRRRACRHPHGGAVSLLPPPALFELGKRDPRALAGYVLTWSRLRRTPMERLLRATINTWHGLLAATRSEEAFRLELIALVLAIPVAFLLAEEAWKRLALIAVVAFVLVVELLNTAIEKLADRVNLAIDPQIGRVKDMGSAAVGLALLIAAMAWLLALAERFGLI